MRWWVAALGALLLCDAASAAQTRVDIPLSATRDGTPSIHLVCRGDGIVGTFVDTSQSGGAASGTVTLFNNSDFVRRAEFFDLDRIGPQGLLALPARWSYPADESQPGFFIATADLDVGGRPEALRALAVRTQMLLLQVATSKFVGIQVGDQKSLVEIDPAELTADRVAQCLRHAGLASALARFDRTRNGPLDRRETTSLCVMLYNQADALLTLVHSFPPERQAELGAAVRHPTRERIDCFRPQTLDADAIGAAAEAAADAAGFDYLSFTAAAAEVPLSAETFAILRDEWAARDLPGQRDAEERARLADRMDDMRKAYFLYSRVLACGEALSASRLVPVEPAHLLRLRTGIAKAERLLGARANLDGLWEESVRNYPRMLGALRSAAASSSTYTHSLCTGEAEKLDTLLTRITDTSPAPRRDFNTTVSAVSLP